MSRSLDDIDEDERPWVFEFLARCTGASVPLMIVDTLRTAAEQAEAIRTGHSQNPHSLHLPQPPRGKARAIDVCPYAVFQLHGPDKLQWDTKDPAWQTIRAIAKQMKLRWGGDWKRPSDPDYLAYRPPETVNPYDPGHLERGWK